jgi:hypothetical protein
MNEIVSRWFGWVAVAGGVGSLTAGVTMFLGFGIVPGWLSIAFAIVVSLWLLAVGILLWRRANARPADELPDRAARA